jgi:hypothetical protein
VEISSPNENFSTAIFSTHNATSFATSRFASISSKATVRRSISPRSTGRDQTQLLKGVGWRWQVGRTTWRFNPGNLLQRASVGRPVWSTYKNDPNRGEFFHVSSRSIYSWGCERIFFRGIPPSPTRIVHTGVAGMYNGSRSYSKHLS